MTQQLAGEYEFWRKVPVAIIVDIDPSACQIDPDIRSWKPASENPRLFGSAVTALCEPPDFGAVLRAADHVGNDQVLVISAGANRDTAMIGEIVSGHVRRHGGAGVVCDGAIRDVVELASWSGFEVYSRYVTPRGPTGANLGSINQTVPFGGLDISPGDLIIGDADGLARLTPAMARDFKEAAAAKLALETEWEARLKSGETIESVFLR